MTTSPVRFVATRFLAGVLALWLTTIAAGQGTEEHFPEPMSWATLRQQLDRLPPAEAQWADLEAAHTIYLVDMEDLRTGPITRWLDTHSGALRGFSEEAAEAKTALRERDVLLRRIASIDDDYFARAATIMGGEQQLALERLRLRRGRDRMVQERHFTPLTSLELADHVDHQLLDQDMRGMLYDWEDTRTDLLRAHVLAKRAQQVALTEMAASWSNRYKAILAAGDPGEDEVQAIAREAQDEARALREPASKAAQAVAEHAWRGARELADVLPPEDAHEMRLTVIRRLGAVVNEDFQHNLRRSGISTDHSAVRPLLEEYWSDMAGLTNTAATTLLALPQEDMLFFDGDDTEQSPWEIRFDRIEQAQAPLQARARRLNEALGALGDPGQPLVLDLAQRPDKPHGTSDASMAFIVTTDVSDMALPEGASVIIGSSVALDGDIMDSGFGMGAMFGFAPLPSSLRGRLIRDLGLDQDGIEAMDALFEAHTTDILESQQAAVSAAVNNDGQAMFTPFGASAEGHTITLTADNAFFDGVEALGDLQAVRWHRLARQRSVALGGGVMGMISIGMGGSGQAHRADPTEALESAGLDDEQVTQGLRVLDAWHASSAAVADTLQSANAAQQAAFHAQIQRQFDEQDDEGGVNVSMSVDGSSMHVLQERLHTAEAALAAANRDGIDALVDWLGEDDGLSVRRAWLVKAWPDVLDRGDPLQASFDTAMRLDNLTDNQRGKIAMLRMQHDMQWWAASEAIIDELDQGADLSGLIAGHDAQDVMSAFQAFERNREELERKKFTRREAALKQLAALREVLTTAQLEQAGGLPDPDQRGGRHIMSF